MRPGPRFTVLIVGCGNIAGGFDSTRAPGSPALTHAGAYRDHGGFDLAACVEPDTDRREAFMADWGVPRGHAELADVAGAAFDVISICSPTALHHRHLELALRLRPRLVFCEKPVTQALEQTQHWVDQYEKAGVLLAVNHTRRWAPDVVRLRNELRDGAWGTLRSISGHYNKGVLNNGSHMLDLIQFLCGPLTLLHAGRPVVDFSPGDPSVPALLETGGAPVQIGIGHAGDFPLFELDLITSVGMVSMYDGGMRWTVRRAEDSLQFKGYRALSPPVPMAGEYGQAMRHAAANIHDALRTGAALASTGATALQAQRLCGAIRKAALETP